MMRTRRRIGAAILYIFLAVVCLSTPTDAQKLSEEEPIEGSGRYVGPSPDDEDFAVEGSGQPVGATRTLRPTAATDSPTVVTSVIHSSGADELFIKSDDSFRTPGGRVSEDSGESADRPSPPVIVGIIALIGLLIVVIIALTCSCTRRRPTSEYMPGTTRSKSYV